MKKIIPILVILGLFFSYVSFADTRTVIIQGKDALSDYILRTGRTEVIKLILSKIAIDSAKVTKIKIVMKNYDDSEPVPSEDIVSIYFSDGDVRTLTLPTQQ